MWQSDEPYYDSFYCNVSEHSDIPCVDHADETQLALKWDTFRTLYPLMSLHDPENFARIVRGMINIQQHEGTYSIGTYELGH